MGAVTERRTLFLWGWNLYGQCGVAQDCEDVRTPFALTECRDVLLLSCGESHTAALIEDS